MRKTLNEDTGDSVVLGTEFKDYMWDLTPIEQKSDGMYYKREDKFALFGINTLNGSKCRQLLHLFETRPENAKIVVHATNVNASPQTPMVAVFAEHYGLECIQVAGGTNFNSINTHELPLFATMFGTKYEIDTGSGFNVNIQKRVKDIMDTLQDSITIERDITLDHKLNKNTPEMIKNFHMVGARQTQNIPEHIEDLILPFGSANSATSVVLGLINDSNTNIKRIHLVNVGVDKRQYMFERLDICGVDYSNYEFVWYESGQPYSKLIKGMQQDDITFHYRYEAKVIKFIRDNHPELIKDTTLFWIIGSVPSLSETAKKLNRSIPTEVELFKFVQKQEEKDKDLEDLF